MLTLKCLGSGSSGNCYILSDEMGRKLILDCGIRIKEVKQALDFELSQIVGVFATHEHTDHFSQWNEFDKLGFDMLAPHLTGKVRVNKEFYPYSLQAFRLPHGDTYSYGVLIRHLETKDTMLYMTDFEYCEYVFKACKVNHYLIECNYQKEYVDFDAPNKEHKLRGHCSLDTCKNFIKANYTGDCKSIILCHLGFGSTNPTECVDEIKTLTDKHVTVDYARPNTTYEL